MFLLALLLALGLPQARPADNRTERQGDVCLSADPGLLRCHVCEKENDFSCQNAQDCAQRDTYCALAAIKIFPRFYYVSKQCTPYCPLIIIPADSPGRSFVILKPLPFVYIKCCKHPLCNDNVPNVNETAFREYPGRAGGRPRGRAVLSFLPALALASDGLRLL
uniref:UPAR/Ly6 domain-containing protein n=1 Tax=Oryctolagus cuniculus TaxID=9986 RepID=G1U593_RABIT